MTMVTVKDMHMHVVFSFPAGQSSLLFYACERNDPDFLKKLPYTARSSKHHVSRVSAGGNKEASRRSGFWNLLFWKDERTPESEVGPKNMSISEEHSNKVIADPVEHIKETWSQVSGEEYYQGETTRRRVLGAPMFMSIASIFETTNLLCDRSANALVPAIIDKTKAPSKVFDATDKRLQDAAIIFEKALNAQTVVEEEALWSLIIEKYGTLDAEWVSDIVSRAYGNRGNARSRQGKLHEALEDYDKSIILAPYAVDPVLNRGVALESLRRFEEASADYVAVLKAQPDDPAAWNNLGNVKAAQNRWDDALRSYAKAVDIAPAFSFAAANYALALYQVGRVNEAIKQFRNLLRRYPEFPDMRAALAVSLYSEGLTAEAENNWNRLEDSRYRDCEWVKNTRRWPPRLVKDLEAFLDVGPSRNIPVSGS